MRPQPASESLVLTDITFRAAAIAGECWFCLEFTDSVGCLLRLRRGLAHGAAKEA
jgi:hypothetical protein